jgi:single-strand DNA-binding protein
VLSLTTKENCKNKQTNEWEAHTEWHRILGFGKLGDFAATLTKGAHIEVEGTLRSREQTLELKGSSKKNPETMNVRSWFIRESIRKLDRAETPRPNEIADWTIICAASSFRAESASTEPTPATAKEFSPDSSAAFRTFQNGLFLGRPTPDKKGREVKSSPKCESKSNTSISCEANVSFGPIAIGS